MTLDVTYNNISNLHSDPIKAGLRTIQLCKSAVQNQVVSDTKSIKIFVFL